MMHITHTPSFASRTLHRAIKVAAIVVTVYAIILVVALLTGALASSNVQVGPKIAETLSLRYDALEAAPLITEDTLTEYTEHRAG